jgi:hypothetical protein
MRRLLAFVHVTLYNTSNYAVYRADSKSWHDICYIICTVIQNSGGFYEQTFVRDADG